MGISISSPYFIANDNWSTVPMEPYVPSKLPSLPHNSYSICFFFEFIYSSLSSFFLQIYLLICLETFTSMDSTDPFPYFTVYIQQKHQAQSIQKLKDCNLPSLMAVGPSAKRATTARVMATSGILFMLTSTAFKCFVPEECRWGPVTVTLFSVQVTSAPIFSRTSANFTSPLIDKRPKDVRLFEIPNVIQWHFKKFPRDIASANLKIVFSKV